MKIRLLFIAFSIILSTACSAQFFKPLPKPGGSAKFGLAKVSADSTMNSFRPVVAISALVSNGTQLAGGFGIGYGHYKWDAASQSWVTQYSIAAIGFLGTDGIKITGTGGLVFGLPGTNGIISVGPGYDFTGKQVVLLTGVQIQFK